MQGTYTLPVAAERSRSWEAVLLPLAIILIALVPRVLNLGLFATMDEVNFWFDRSEAFLNALRSGNFAATAITDHPGVTTMWLGAASLLLRDALVHNGLIADLTPQLFIALYEVPITVFNSICVGLGYMLLRGMLPRGVALLGALLWALDPFVIAYNRVLHVDGLAGTFMTLCLIAACRYWFHTGLRRDLIISGVCAGLGMVTKSPALIMAPTVGMIALAAAFVVRGRFDFGWLVRSMLIWSIACLAAAVVCWPALWADPIAAYTQVKIGYTAEGTQPHQTGNFFLGQFDAAPGPIFYPLAILLRLTPITTVGLLALPFAWWRMDLSPQTRRTLLGWLWFVVFFTIAMSFFAKKFNRYIVPAFPTIDLLGAVGLFWLAAALGALVYKRWPAIKQASTQAVLAGLAVALAVANVVYWHPYHIAAYNQLFGGAKTGAWAFKTGWGEGMNLAADWLNQQENITGVLTVTSLTVGLQTYLKPGAQSIWPPIGPLPEKSGYVVIYVNDEQVDYLPAPFDRFWQKVKPLKVITIHGVEYAWIYEAPPQVDREQPASFGSDIQLHGYRTQDTAAAGTTASWQLVWYPHGNLPDGTMMFAHLIGEDNQRYAQIDLPLPTAADARYLLMDVPLTIPADTPPGRYRLVIGLYALSDGQRQPLVAEAAADPALDGPNALIVDTITVTAP